MNTLSPLAHTQLVGPEQPLGATGVVRPSESIFDEHKSQNEMKLNKTSRLNQRLNRGPGGLV